jgi:hypothetical protein
MKSRTKRVIRRIKQVWDELGYAQRRMFEIRTGVPVRPNERPKISRSVEELERLYAA